MLYFYDLLTEIGTDPIADQDHFRIRTDLLGVDATPTWAMGEDQPGFTPVPGQEGAAFPGTTGSFTVSLPANPTPGNMVALLVATTDFSGNSSVTSAVDGNSNAYTHATGSPSNGLNILFLGTVPANGDKTITITVSNSLRQCAAWIKEFACPGGSFDALAVHAFGGNSTNLNLPSLTPNADDALLVAIASPEMGITSANAPWTGIKGIDPNVGSYAEWLIQTTGQAQAVSFTQSPTGAWSALAASFVSTPYNPPADPIRMRFAVANLTNVDTLPFAYQLQYRINNGAWQSVTTTSAGMRAASASSDADGTVIKVPRLDGGP